MVDLLALADRVEKLTGPDHQIDRMIFAAIYGWSYPLAGAASMEFESETRIHGRTNYTASLDAAMTLVPPMSLWSVCDMEEGPFSQVIRPMPCGGYINGLTTAKGATPALALTAACLRARASTDKGEA